MPEVADTLIGAGPMGAIVLVLGWFYKRKDDHLTEVLKAHAKQIAELHTQHLAKSENYMKRYYELTKTLADAIEALEGDK